MNGLHWLQGCPWNRRPVKLREVTGVTMESNCIALKIQFSVRTERRGCSMSGQHRKTGTFGGDSTLIHVTPESAGWQYVGFQVVQLAEGQSFTRESSDQAPSYCLWWPISTREHAWENVGKRMSIFEKTPPIPSIYPAPIRWRSELFPHWK